LHSSSYLLFINLQIFSLEFNMLFVIITHLFHYNYLIISHLCKRYSFPTNSHTTTPLYYVLLKSIELHMISSATQLFCQLLLPPMYTIKLHYRHRCSNIHTIDELRPSLFLRCLYNYLWRHHCNHHLIYYSSIYR
jgi:hypothetical protein